MRSFIQDNALPSLLSGSPEPTESVDRVLQVIRSHLGTDVGFISEFLGNHRVLRYVDSSASEAPVKVGDRFSLEEGYCQRIVDGRLPELIPDTAEVPAAMEIPATRAMPIGAHLGVPIKLKDGRLYGTLCCFSVAANRSLNPRDLHMMHAFAELAAHLIDRNREAAQDHERKVVRITSAIEEQELSVVYQPIFEIKERRIIGLEGLARFSGVPRRPPNVWFSEAAEVGMGLELELAAVEAALRELPVLSSEIYVSVNVSPTTLLSLSIASVLGPTFAERIVLEVTEHAAIGNYANLISALEPLQRSGIRLAIDDAGAGYASFRHILHLKPDLIKLDMSLIRDIDTDPAKQALASALIHFASDIGASIIAEGVETQSELAALQTLGVTKAQGYFLGRPLPLASTLSCLEQSRANMRSLAHVPQWA